MTTEQATDILAGIYATGADLNYPDEIEAERHLDAARTLGQAWEWAAAIGRVNAAYRAIGAEPPAATGYDWHRGEHPIQLATAR